MLVLFLFAASAGASFLAMGQNAQMTSDDGVVWTVHNVSFTGAHVSAQSVAIGGSILVSGGDFGLAYASALSLPPMWQMSSSATLFDTVFSVAHDGEGTWLAGGFGRTTLASSTDGKSWTAMKTDGIFSVVRYVTYEANHQVWLAGGAGHEGSVNTTSLAVSSDRGATWKALPSPFHEVYCIEYDATTKLWVLAGEQGPTSNYSALAYSTDLSTWTPAAARGGFVEAYSVAVSPTSHHWVAGGGLFAQTMMASSNGKLWQVSSYSGFSAFVNQVIATEHMFLAVGGMTIGSAPTQMVAVSPDGLTWKNVHVLNPSNISLVSMNAVVQI